jgi:hypothetical protein
MEGDGAAIGVLTVLRARAEKEFAGELDELASMDDRQRPPSWRLSPWAVRTYLLGGVLPNGFAVSPKYFGNIRLMEIAISTLATDRALLLSGVPGTGKSWVSEHLAAAISVDSSLMVQGTAGTDESAIRYGWNYAELLRSGPTVIATANSRDRAVNELSSALTRRFNTVVLPLPETLEQETEIVANRVESMGRALELPAEKPALEEIRRLVTIFRELRNGVTEDGQTKIKSPSGTLSTAEAISVMNGGLAMAAYYGDGVMRAGDLAAGLTGTIIRDPVQDRIVWQEYLQSVVRGRDDWKDFYRACREVL